MNFNRVELQVSTKPDTGRAARPVSTLVILVATASFVLAALPAPAATITVSPGQSISTAISQAATGDTIIVKAGNYSNFSLNKAVTVRSEVRLGARLSGGVSVSASNATLDGFYIDGGGIIASGSQTSTTPSNVRIINNHAYRSSYLYKVIGSNWLVEGNTFQRVVYSGSGDADYGRMFGSGHVFRRNYFFGTSYGVGQDIEPNSAHTDAMQYFGNNGEKLQNILIEQNFITDFFQGFFLADERSVTDISNLTIRDNILWGTPLPNTGNMHGRPSWGICVGKNNGATNARLENNLIYNVANATGMRGGHVNSYVGGNLIVNCGTNYSSYSGDITRAGDFTGNPLFADASNPLGADGVPFTADDGWRPTAAAAAGFGPRISGGTTPPPPPPTTPVVNAVNDSFSGINEDTSNHTLNVLTNDTVTPSTGNALSITSVTNPSSGGTVAIVSGTSLRYTPRADFFGNETLIYTAVSTGGGSDTATVTVTVNTVNDPPNATNDSASVQGGSTNNIIAVLSNDSMSPDTNETLTVSAVTTPNQGGTATIDQNIRVQYTPAPAFSGTETFTYTCRDSNGGTDTATVNVTVQPVAPPPPPPSNSAPDANSDSFAVNENSSANVLAVLANDSDPDGDPLSIVELTPASAGGTISVSGSTLIYTPPADFIGTESFSYSISDGNGGTANATVTVSVEDDNTPPVAVNDAFTVDMDSSANELDVLANDSDPDAGDSIVITGIGTGNRGGTASINGGALVTYTPASGFEGDELFTYTISDANGTTASAQITITVEDSRPQPKPDRYKVWKDRPNNRFNVTRNDTWKWGESLTVEVDNSSSRIVAAGQVTIVDNDVLYTPPQGFVGSDTFTYAVRDERDQVATAEVVVEVSQEFGIDFCDDHPAFVAQIGAFWDDFGIETTDLDGDAIPDDFMLLAMQIVACFDSGTQMSNALKTAYLVNLIQFDEEANGDTLAAYREVIAALLTMNTEMQAAVLDLLNDTGLPLDGTYESVWRDAGGVTMPQSLDGVELVDGYEVFDSTDGLEQPFSAAGDIDLDEVSNLTEFQNVVAAGGGANEFANAANDAALDGSDVGGGGGDGGCFIATAAYGTPLAVEIDVLRELRDRFMLTNAFGGIFADMYYRLSPPIARVVSDHPAIARAIRVALDPVVGLSRGVLAAPIALWLVLLLPAAFLVRRAKRATRRS